VSSVIGHRKGYQPSMTLPPPPVTNCTTKHLSNSSKGYSKLEFVVVIIVVVVLDDARR
jgi:hypothetical protein